MRNATSMFLPWIIEGTIPALPASGNGLALQEGLKPPQSGPVLVDELRFQGFDSTWLSANDNVAFIGTVRATISVGRQVLCNDVPLDVLCKVLDLNGEFASLSSPGSARIWRFPKPLYLPDNGQINVQLRVFDPTGSVVIPVVDWNVAALGRSLPTDFRAPDLIDVPFASFWNAPASIANFVAESTPSDLVNPFTTDLEVQRFSFLPLVSVNLADNRNNFIDDLGASMNALLQLFGENGILGVRDQTPAGDLMHYGKLSWVVNAILKPGGFFIADLNYTVNPLQGFTPKVAFMLGMVGSRKVHFAELGV